MPDLTKPLPPAMLGYIATLMRSQLEDVPGADSVLQHSQSHLDAGTQRETPGGTNTFLGEVITEPWMNNGRPSLVPTFINGDALDTRTKQGRRAQREFLTSGGKTWPSAGTIDDALQLERLIHAVMEMQRKGYGAF